MEQYYAGERSQKLFSLSIHDDHASNTKDEVIFNLDRFPELKVQVGDLVRIAPILESATLKSKSPAADKSAVVQEANQNRLSSGNPPPESMSGAPVKTYDDSGALISQVKYPDIDRSYMFTARPLTPEQKVKYPNVDLSISQHVAQKLGFKKRMPVLVSTVPEDGHAASHVEIIFRDQYLSRADMWRLAITELSQRTIYKDQKIIFLDTIKATIKNIYLNGEKKKSGFFGRNTKPIFRSESARYVVFIQMSREMWEFDVEGGGEIMFNKVVNGFLPDLFKSWTSIQAHHLITIVLFTRIEYDHQIDSHFNRTAPSYRDFYRVVVNDWQSHDWIKILTQLKKEFRCFLRDVTIQQPGDELNEIEISSENSHSRKIIGQPSVSSKGNILEAISLASTHFAEDYIDRDLVRTGISVVVITAGTGIYEVDYNLLKMSTDTLISSGIGIDLVCLAPMPLHSVPLFKYRNPKVVEQSFFSRAQSFSSLDNTPKQSDIYTSNRISMSNRPTPKSANIEPIPGEWSYAIPHWIDVSFWKRTEEEQSILSMAKNSRRQRKKEGIKQDKPFNLRCVLYELEMMGFMENEMANHGIQLLQDIPLHPFRNRLENMPGKNLSDKEWENMNRLDREWMDNYDRHIFSPLHSRVEAEKSTDETMKNPSSIRSDSTLLEPGVSTSKPESSRDHSNQGYLEWKVGSSTPVRMKAPAPTRQPSTISLMSNKMDKDSIRSASSGFSRPTMIIPPVEALTKVDGEVKPVLVTNMESTGNKPAGSQTNSLFETFRSALSRPLSNKSTQIKSIAKDEDSCSIKSESNKVKPIKITNPNKKPPAHSRTSSDGQIGSLETVKGVSALTRVSPTTRTTASNNTRARRTAESGIFTAVSGKSRKNSLMLMRLSASGESQNQTPLSPTSALAPWLVLVNPGNPHKNNISINNQFRKWQHVFPKRLKTSSVKWKSLTSPASVPLTNEFFPTVTQLEDEYRESPYKVTATGSIDDELEQSNDLENSREGLVRELVSLRLAHGFQLVVGNAVQDHIGRGSDGIDVMDKELGGKDGEMVFMVAGNVIHQLTFVSGGAVEVKRYTRKPTAEVEAEEGSDGKENGVYRPWIRTALGDTYNSRAVKLGCTTTREEINWNYIDSFVAGHADHYTENLKYWRARFVFIPVDIPFRTSLATVTEDTEEEVRLEGIRKLTHLWSRHRVFLAEERGYQSNLRRLDQNPLEIDYHTRDASAIIAAGIEGSLLGDPDVFKPSIFSETEQYTTSNFDLNKLAQELQGENGIKMIDRRWHLKLYQNCFIGSDLVTWILDRFRDVETRDDAVTFGGELMDKKLFNHVREEHNFREGLFFYQMTLEYRVTRPGAGWFGSRKDRGSVPSTPMSETAIGKQVTNNDGTSRPGTDNSLDSSDEESQEKGEISTRQYMLSGMMRYNVDPRKHSYRPEIINLHYDRLHNPDNCYHFRVEWMNVTTKFIEDAIYDWAIHGKKYGLKLVQVPIAEAFSVGQSRPFREPYRIKLAIPPPTEALTIGVDTITSSAGPHPIRDKFVVQKAILKKLQFVLDFESADSFPQDVEVAFSWGKNTAKYTQYVHRSGTMLAQITEEGDFVLLPNRLYNERLSSFKLEKVEKVESQERRVPTASPMVRPVLDALPEAKSGFASPAEDVKSEVESFCHNESLLKLFYTELIRLRQQSPSPSLVGSPGASIPSLRLPPRAGPQSRDDQLFKSSRSSRSSSSASLATMISKGGTMS